MLAHVFLVGPTARLEMASLRREFPSLRFQLREPCASDVPIVEPEAFFARAAGWDAEHALARTIRRTHALAIDVSHTATDGALKLCTRLQRLVNRRNARSCSARFDVVLARHRALHDLGRPPALADWEHALDAWQWLLRLDASASLPLQVAVLFHDHQAAGERGLEVLDGVLPSDELDEVARLVARQQRADGDPALQLVHDADALSFLSLDVCAYFDSFGPVRTLQEIAWALGRLSPAARARLAQIGFRSDVRALVENAVANR